MPKFAQTLLKSGTGRIEPIKGLKRLERRTNVIGRTTYLVQIVNEPYKVVTLEGRHDLLILLSANGVAELIVEPR